MYVREQCVRAMETASIRDTQKGRQGRMSRGARRTKGREGILRMRGRWWGVSFFIWWYWFEGCLAEAPKAVLAWILACHLGQGH